MLVINDMVMVPERILKVKNMFQNRRVGILERIIMNVIPTRKNQYWREYKTLKKMGIAE